MTTPEPKPSRIKPLAAWRSGISAAALMLLDLPPIRYVVPDYIVEGLTVLAGAPKARKSWMMLDVATAVASGGHALGSIKCEQGDVLYLALEDNRRRLQDRLRKMDMTEAAERLTLCTMWPTGDAAVAEIEAWADAVEKPVLAIVDTLIRVREMIGKEASYDADYRALSALQDLALRLGIAIVVVHHTRKSDAVDPFDEVSGTRGLTGAADTVLVLRRENTGTASHRATLYGRGRDIPEIERALEFHDNNFRWSVLGDSRCVAATIEQQEILALLNETDGPMKLAEIVKAVGKSSSNVRNLLAKMISDVLVTQPKTGWYAAVKTMNSMNPQE